jgi:hypothetical protein
MEKKEKVIIPSKQLIDNHQETLESLQYELNYHAGELTANELEQLENEITYLKQIIKKLQDKLPKNHITGFTIKNSSGKGKYRKKNKITKKRKPKKRKPKKRKTKKR